MEQFVFSRTPYVIFGPAKFSMLGALLKECNFHSILVIGSRSFNKSPHWDSLLKQLSESNIGSKFYSVTGEPSAELVDSISGEHRNSPPDAVVSIGGGSVIDAGKAISAMIKTEGSVVDYLEVIGSKAPPGIKVPFVAIPTTSGTGSEATKNAVLSRTGEEGFKRSLRHENYVPDTALIDPELALSCPRDVTAASGMDAITQLIEGLVSVKGNPLSRALAVSGLEYASQSYPAAVLKGNSDIKARSDMAYAAFISGIVLANAGLGVVHGLASPIGSRFNVPHGVVCGTLLASATERIVDWLIEYEGEHSPALALYAEAGRILAGREKGTTIDDCRQLVAVLYRWTEDFEIKRLKNYGLQAKDTEWLAEESGVIKNSPARLGKQDIVAILRKRL
ncbi:MAG: iron-containing alcohol dehydrogenase [Spirochaetota bacterium]